MGAFRHPLTVLSTDGARAESVEALVDTGATYTMLPSSFLIRLGWAAAWEQEFEMADGRRVTLPLAEVRVRLDGAERTTICIFARPDADALLGVFTLEAFSLGIDTVNRRLVPVPGLLKKVAGKWVCRGANCHCEESFSGRTTKQSGGESRAPLQIATGFALAMTFAPVF